MIIADIIKRCGGASAIVSEAKRRGQDISYKGVWRWRISGIRWQWFDLVMDLGAVSLEQIHAANKDALGKQKKTMSEAA